MSTINVEYLVVGGDGLIGSHLVTKLRKIGARVVKTTRRKVKDDINSIRLNLSSALDLSSWTYTTKEGVVFLCAGITNMIFCETEPCSSTRINVMNTLTLAKKLQTSGMKIVFLSSNTVFDGELAWPQEDNGYRPCTAYGRQKVATEQALMKLPGAKKSITIVRLSKVLTLHSGIASEFMRLLMAGEPCPAFSDLRISPVSLPYILDSLLTIVNKRQAGIFHLSGEEELSYSEFAKRLAIHIGADPKLVQPTSSMEVGVKVLFRPKHPALGMKRTTEILNIKPEPCSKMLAKLTS